MSFDQLHGAVPVERQISARRTRQTDRQTNRHTDTQAETVSQSVSQSKIQFSYLDTLDQNMIDVEWKARYTARQ